MDGRRIDNLKVPIRSTVSKLTLVVSPSLFTPDVVFIRHQLILELGELRFGWFRFHQSKWASCIEDAQCTN
jgi:hypothetical protein